MYRSSHEDYIICQMVYLRKLAFDNAVSDTTDTAEAAVYVDARLYKQSLKLPQTGDSIVVTGCVQIK